MYGQGGALMSDDVRVRRRCPERTESVRTCSIVGVYTGTKSYEPRNMGEYLHSDGAFPTPSTIMRNSGLKRLIECSSLSGTVRSGRGHLNKRKKRIHKCTSMFNTRELGKTEAL